MDCNENIYILNISVQNKFCLLFSRAYTLYLFEIIIQVINK